VIYIKKINIFKDARGTLAVLENKNFKFFSIKRSFFIDFKKKKIQRGEHAHKKCSQFIFCITGKIRLNTINNKLKKRQIILSNMKKGVYIEPLVWVKITSEMNNTAIACFADREYEKNDYIHNFNEFKKIIKK
jgi:UDP-2-acetamido-3-amino-2,3-dideoxy-glucuronate N-acetyltransferase